MHTTSFKNVLLILCLCCCLYIPGLAQTTGDIIEVYPRDKISLNGKWHYIIDPTQNGYYDYRREPFGEGIERAYFSNTQPRDKAHRVEYDFAHSPTLMVPGDWNSQVEQLLWYEGTVWYQRTFTYTPGQTDGHSFLYFGAVNYAAEVFVNGAKIGEHQGGFTPFALDVTKKLKPGGNDVVVKVSNTRKTGGIPTVSFDWWNYGGITRDVYLVEVPPTYIADYALQLVPGDKNRISGYVRLSGTNITQETEVAIPELGITRKVRPDEQGMALVDVTAKKLVRWSPENPKRYEVVIRTGEDEIIDQIGFRTLETDGQDILLNGERIFLRGICAHEENPMEGRRNYSMADAFTLMNWIKELDANFIRLAHYPHNEHVPRLAEEMGILLWEEIPVYWTIDWENEETLANAKQQLTELIRRDKNRASVIIWSVANETPVSPPRTAFLKSLADHASELDTTRFISAALELKYEGKKRLLDDPIGEYLDVISFNQYHGWYGGVPEDFPSLEWEINYDKPVIVSEWGGGALYGFHADSATVWSEEYQARIYRNTLEGLENIPGLAGTTPWILTDFRSPRRPLAMVQDYWNIKGIISRGGHKKLAFWVLKDYYAQRIRKRR